MTEIHVPEVEQRIQELRVELDRIYAYLDGTEHTLDQLEERAHRVRDVLGQWEDRIRQSRSQIQTILQPMEHAATVMQRELTHVEELRGVDLRQDPDASIRAVSALLHLSVQLAAMLFPPAQLEALAGASTPYALDSLRQRWQRWLEELAAYLAQVLSLAGSLSKVGEAGPMSRSYQQALQELSQQSRQLEALGGDAGKPQPEHEAPTRVMAHLTGGPLGNRLLHLPSEPLARYPHSIGIFASQIAHGCLVSTFIPLIEAGEVPREQPDPRFLQMVIPVREEQVQRRLPVYIRLHGTGEPRALHIPEVEYPPAGRYHVALVVDRSNLASLIFRPVDGGEERVYHLGDLKILSDDVGALLAEVRDETSGS